MEVFAVSALINALVATALGLFVIAYDPKNKVNRLYFFLGLSVAFWSAAYWRWQLSTDETSALFWVRILSIGSTFIPVFYFHWVASLLERDKKEKKAIIFTYILAFIILLFSFSPLFIKDVRPKMYFPFWPDPGILYHAYLAYVYCILVTYSISLLSKEYKNSSGERRAQIIYVIIGSVVGFGGGLFNFFLWYDIPIPPYGNFLVALYPFFLGYAVIKYRLFDIKIVVTEVLVFLLWIFLLIKTLLSNTPKDLLINGGILIGVAIIGILLIRGILKDVKQREKIEKAEKEVERALEAEKKANDTLELFMTGLQHDVKGYLTPIITGSPSLLKGDGVFSNREKDGIYLNKDGVRMIEIFERSALAARDQAEDFLTIAKFRTGKPIVALESSVEIGSMLDELTNFFKHEAEQKGVAIKFEKPGKKFFVSSDETKLKSALRNVIGNSMKYTREGWVVVDLEEKEKNKILIKVQDTGIGILPEKIATLFSSPFERANEAKKTASGAGFGLYFASLIIGLHNGKIWAESKGNDMGSTFFIELPVSQKID